ncbi:MAG: response regulator [Anaerolineae bacterium]|nr:response regulator [Phycisphaerae bacterium]
MPHAVAQSHRFTVLLANEQEGWHQTVRQLLQPQGVETVSARSGREALSLMESRPIHCAVLDAHMPQLGGLQVIKLMRELQSRRDPSQAIPPSILLANQLTSHLLHEALGMHVFSVLSKPVDFNVLLDTLARVLKRHYENKWPCENANGETVSANGNGNGHANGNGHRQAS